MNELKVFNNPEFGEIRTMEIDGEPWMVGKDVATALGYGDTDQALRKHVDDEDKLTRQIDGSGQSRAMTIINESGLYSLVLSSKLPGAKKFKRWVTSEVLPSIRKTGAYSAYNADDLSPELRLLINMEMQQKAQRRALEDVSKRVDDIRDVVALNASNWREDCRKLLAKIAVKDGGDNAYQEINEEAFAEVERRASCDLDRRLKNKRVRMALAGASRSRQKSTNRLDVIADDQKLVEIYIAVVKDMAIQHGVKK